MLVYADVCRRTALYPASLRQADAPRWCERMRKGMRNIAVMERMRKRMRKRMRNIERMRKRMRNIAVMEPS